MMERNITVQDSDELCEAPHHHSGLALEEMKEKIPGLGELERVAELFKVLGDPTRMQVLTALFL